MLLQKNALRFTRVAAVGAQKDAPCTQPVNVTANQLHNQKLKVSFYLWDSTQTF